MQAGVGRQAMEKSAANINTLSRFETEGSWGRAKIMSCKYRK